MVNNWSKCSIWLLGVMLAGASIGPSRAQEPHRSFDGGVASMFTRWEVDHVKDDGTGRDVCIMIAGWPGRPVRFSLRKDVTRNYFTVRILDPGVSFTAGAARPVTVAFDGDLATHSWSGQASGVGTVFDLPLPGGAALSRFETQLLATDLVTVVVGSHVWTQSIGDTARAYGLFRDCLASVTAGDRRW